MEEDNTENTDLIETIEKLKKVFGLSIPMIEIADYMKADVGIVHSQIREKIISGEIDAHFDSKNTMERSDDILIIKVLRRTDEDEDECWEKLRLNLQNGIKCYKAKLSKNPEDESLLHGLAWGYLLQNDLEKTKSFLDEGISTKMSLNCIKLRSLIAINEEEGTKALSLVNRALELYPKDKELWRQKAFIHLKLGEPEQALEASNTVLRLYPDEKTILEVKIASLLDLERYEEALEVTELALKTTSEEFVLTVAKLICLTNLNKFEEIEQFREKYPESKEIRYLLAQIAIDKGDYKRGMELASESLYNSFQGVLNGLIGTFTDSSRGWIYYKTLLQDFVGAKSLIIQLETFYTNLGQVESAKLMGSSLLETTGFLTSLGDFDNESVPFSEFLKRIEDDDLRSLFIFIYKLRKGESEDVWDSIPDLIKDIKFVRTHSLEFLEAIVCLSEYDLDNATMLMQKAGVNNPHLKDFTEYIWGLAETFSSLRIGRMEVTIQTIPELIHSQKSKIELHNRFDELTGKYEEISLKKMTRLMGMKNIAELEEFLLSLPEEVPIKISGDNVYLGQHDTTYEMKSRMRQALTKWERSILSDIHESVFACQLDGGTYPISEPHYQCSSCNRFVCESCHKTLSEVGRVICPFCDGSLRFISWTAKVR